MAMFLYPKDWLGYNFCKELKSHVDKEWPNHRRFIDNHKELESYDVVFSIFESGIRGLHLPHMRRLVIGSNNRKEMLLTFYHELYHVNHPRRGFTFWRQRDWLCEVCAEASAHLKYYWYKLQQILEFCEEASVPPV